MFVLWCSLLLLVVHPATTEVLDMTYKFQANVTIYWPGKKEFRLENEFKGNYDAPNGQRIWLEMEEYSAASHGGTHVDAPSHILKKRDDTRWTVDEIPADRLMGPLRVINVVAKAAQNPNYQVTVTDIARHEDKHGPIPRGAIVLMNSGWSSKWPDKSMFLGPNYKDPKLSFPGFSVDSAQWLTTMRDIYGVGVDTPSLDHGPSPDFAAHTVFLQKNIYGLENVAAVDKVPEAGATVFAFPMKNKGASGGPCRVVAIWGDDRVVLGGSSNIKFSGLVLSLTAVIAMWKSTGY